MPHVKAVQVLYMGKRKRAKPPPAKPKPKVAVVFDCPFCGNADACTVKMDVDHQQGTIACHTCRASYGARISRLSEPIDVYSEWIDMCESANKDGGAVRNVDQEEEDEAREEEEG